MQAKMLKLVPARTAGGNWQNSSIKGKQFSNIL